MFLITFNLQQLLVLRPLLVIIYVIKILINLIQKKNFYPHIYKLVQTQFPDQNKKILIIFQSKHYPLIGDIIDSAELSLFLTPAQKKSLKLSVFFYHCLLSILLFCNFFLTFVFEIFRNWDPKFSKYEKQKMKGILKCSSIYYFHQNYTIYSMQLI